MVIGLILLHFFSQLAAFIEAFQIVSKAHMYPEFSMYFFSEFNLPLTFIFLQGSFGSWSLVLRANGYAGAIFFLQKSGSFHSPAHICML